MIQVHQKDLTCPIQVLDLHPFALPRHLRGNFVPRPLFRHPPCFLAMSLCPRLPITRVQSTVQSFCSLEPAEVSCYTNKDRDTANIQQKKLNNLKINFRSEVGWKPVCCSSGIKRCNSILSISRRWRNQHDVIASNRDATSFPERGWHWWAPVHGLPCFFFDNLISWSSKMFKKTHRKTKSKLMRMRKTTRSLYSLVPGLLDIKLIPLRPLSSLLISCYSQGKAVFVL